MPETFHPNQAEVKSKFYELSRLYHPDRFAQAGGHERSNALKVSAMNNEAYNTLRNSDATMAYILKLHNLLEDEEKYTLPNTFLMEMMDLNEALSDFESTVRVSPAEPRVSPVDPPETSDAYQMAVNALNEQMELWDDATKLLTARFEKGDKSNELLLQIKDQYFRKKYLLRIKERIDKFASR